MTCTDKVTAGCSEGYDYTYNKCCVGPDSSSFWTIFLWITMPILVILCCLIMIKAIKRRRLQMTAIAHRNLSGDE